MKRSLGSERGPKSFHVQRDKASFDYAMNSPTKTKQNAKLENEFRETYPNFVITDNDLN